MSFFEVIEISEKSKDISSKLLNLDQIKNLIENFNNREFYIIDSRYSFDISSIIIKKKCILLKLDFIRAIIKKNSIHIININSIDFDLYWNEFFWFESKKYA